jgi:VanZ family protein
MNLSPTGGTVFRWFVVFLWMGVIFFLSHQPDLPHHPEAILDLIIKKSAHMAEYAILAALAWWAFRRIAGTTSTRAFVYAFVLAALYAVSDEGHQYLVPGRNPQLLDVGFDVLGAVLSLLIIRRILPVREVQRTR